MTKKIWMSVALALMLAAGCDGESPSPDAGTGAGDASVTPECGQSTTLCGSACVDTDVNREHCGACGAACGAGEACVEGECSAACPASQTRCDDACVNTDQDRRHCGACGAACASGEACVDGTCELSCPEGQTACAGACVDLESNPEHCGACESACDVGVCSEGACAGSCGPGLTECDGACVDTSNHPDHCGACGSACGSATGGAGLCMAGECRLACEPLQGDCNGDLDAPGGDGCETPLATDVDNCGVCGRTCELDRAVAGCVSGDCAIVSCEDGYDDCDGSLANGCEANLAEDVFSCGACGTVCAAGEQCYSGVCAPVAGESCADPVVLSPGSNTVYWTASVNDYMQDDPSCSTINAEGPDVVLSYTATTHEQVALQFAKPPNNRWHVVVSTAACGEASQELTCASESTDPLIGTTFTLAMGQTAYIYVVSTVTGDLPLDNPMDVTVTTDPIPCAPGYDGIIGSTSNWMVTGGSSFTEYYVVADQDPNGFVYAGGSIDLYRFPKSGTGPVFDVAEAAGLETAHLGYDMLIDGNNIFTLDSAEGLDQVLYRISSDGGATWNIEDYAFFPSAPQDDFKAMTSHGGRIYLVTDEVTNSVPTEIWSVPADETLLPAIGALELSLPTLHDCNGIARDDSFYYLSCDDAGDQILRVPVGGGSPQLVTSAIDVSTTKNALHGHDIDGDGTFDTLYVQNAVEGYSFVCQPAGAMPFATEAFSFGTGSSNYGLGFDRTSNTLWLIDDDDRDLISVQ